MKKSDWKNVVLAIIKAVDYDLWKSYDADCNIDGLEPEELEENINDLIKVAKSAAGTKQ